MLVYSDGSHQNIEGRKLSSRIIRSWCRPYPFGRVIVPVLGKVKQSVVLQYKYHNSIAGEYIYSEAEPMNSPGRQYSCAKGYVGFYCAVFFWKLVRGHGCRRLKAICILRMIERRSEGGAWCRPLKPTPSLFLLMLAPSVTMPLAPCHDLFLTEAEMIFTILNTTGQISPLIICLRLKSNWGQLTTYPTAHPS